MQVAKQIKLHGRLVLIFGFDRRRHPNGGYFVEGGQGHEPRRSDSIFLRKNIDCSLGFERF